MGSGVEQGVISRAVAAFGVQRRKLAAMIAPMVAALMLIPGTATAQLSMPDEAFSGQVVLELYTAQGCASCPPADAMMAELAMREDVIALALHVDYWDYIGWEDVFADPEHAERQKRYARRHGHSTIYTPQVVINGMDIMEGFRVLEVMDTIAAHRLRPARIELLLERPAPDRLVISAQRMAEAEGPMMLTSRSGAQPAPALLGALASEAEPQPLDLQLVRYTPTAHVEILAGENAGRRAQYFNIVTSWERIAGWDMQAPLEMSVAVEGSDPAVVILQEPGQGAIVAAARLR